MGVGGECLIDIRVGRAHDPFGGGMGGSGGGSRMRRVRWQRALVGALAAVALIIAELVAIPVAADAAGQNAGSAKDLPALQSDAPPKPALEQPAGDMSHPPPSVSQIDSQSNSVHKLGKDVTPQ